MGETKEITKEQDFVSTLPNRIISVVGATSTILIIFIIAYWLKLIPSGVSLSIGLFISLPLVFSFIFGIIMNRPNFTSTWRHYSFGAYLVIALVIYFIYMKPDSFMLFGKYLVQFFVGLIFTLLSGTFYLIPYRILREKPYRWKASISFVISLVLSFLIIFILRYYKIFEMIN